MELAAEHDVIIVGAGPAGSSAAIRLATIGLNVAIIERLNFPRPHVGICISDQTLALLNYLDLGDEFRNARFWRRNLTAVNWGRAAMRLVPQKGFHVDRAILDQLMLSTARAAGVTVYQPARVLDTRSLKDSGWQMTIANDDGRHVLEGRFIVDAAGRRSAFRGPRVKDSPPLLAIHADWTLNDTPEFDGLIESGADAWLWYAQTARDRAIISVFCDPRHLNSKMRGNLQTSYVHLLQQFQLLQPNRFGQQCSGPWGCDAASQHSGDPISDEQIRVGDACLCVDPLSSQGVHLALQSGIQAAIIVNTILKKPVNAELAKQFFQMRVAERVSRYTDIAKIEYSRVSAVRPESFWHERAGNATSVESHAISPPIESPPRPPPTKVTVSPDATIEQAPVIDGMFVEKRQVLRHPNIEGAIAYVDGVNLVALLSVLPQEFSYREIPAHWREHIPIVAASNIASWLWKKRILVGAT